eukprot:4672616-Prymnesium_polylepis.1
MSGVNSVVPCSRWRAPTHVPTVSRYGGPSAAAEACAPSAMAAPFLNSYKGACEAASVSPSTGVLAAASGVLSAKGNVGKMRDQRLTDVDMKPLVSALMNGHDFEEIDLSYNRLAHGAAAELRQLLANDVRVRVLNLAENDIGPEAIQQLCGALKGNMTLEELALSGNTLGGVGGLAVADLLQSPNGLKRLALSNCELTTESLVALATVLQVSDEPTRHTQPSPEPG